MSLPGDTALGGPSRGFPSTHWSILSSLRDREDPRWRERVEALARLYWKPIYRHIRISWRLSNEEAKDATQDFFCHILEGGFLDAIRASKGRFRAFVKACLENFLRQRARDAGRLKRGGGRAILSFAGDDDAPPEPASPAASPEEALDLEWRRALMSEAVGRLKAAYEKEGRPKYFEVFRRLDLEAGPGERPKYRELAAELAIADSDVDNWLSHARKRLVDIVREIVAESVAAPEALEAEMKELFPRGGGR
jgi:RNA polymerase sigma factor (sigma-70 family)